jgi:hypothetical protein
LEASYRFCGDREEFFRVLDGEGWAWIAQVLTDFFDDAGHFSQVPAVGVHFLDATIGLFDLFGLIADALDRATELAALIERADIIVAKLDDHKIAAFDGVESPAIYSVGSWFAATTSFGASRSLTMGRINTLSGGYVYSTFGLLLGTPA